ncbi:glycerophosphodiester phosphodiesterase family protein [Microbacterium sp. ASV81]|uniref:Glycerophosphodiester phosphodiesterase family protein n=1 Tax=Microbacterium capsulatum TaxID=3041921 RepID=A0ABU0XD07_9MICO|nr:glycerophosphodiester phosphodiesterase family protein [Microbacterium sp. ASV81]MDQ4212842.1 glycerophosphodiester phosphodiesterase family protein [Microbacterium sp. ASV81]
MTHPYLEGAATPRVLAHRGLPAAAGEDSSVFDNSALALAAADAAGAQYIETDCRLTADGDVVLFHDETLERLLGDPRPVAEVGTRELEELFSHHGGLLTLPHALDAFPLLRFNIDVKAEDAAAGIGRAVAPHGARVLLTSFHDRNRRAALDAAAAAGAELLPASSAGQVTIALLLVASTLRLGAWVRRILRGIDAVQIPERFGVLRVFTPALVRATHRAGVEVHVWTVNDPERMQILIAAGADGIVTDRADVAIRTLQPN